MHNEIEVITARKDQTNDEPLVSVVVINSGGWDSLRRTLTSLAGQQFTAFEILLVDNGSSDFDSKSVFDIWPRSTILRSPTDMGFSAAANMASKMAQGRYFFFSDSRSWFNNKSLGKLVETIETEPDAGIVGPLTLMKDGSLKSIGMKIDQMGLPSANLELFGGDTEVVENVFYVSSSAMIVNADLFTGISGFDERYFTGLEDADFCWRARLLGRKTVINPWAIAFNEDEQDISYLQYRNSLRMIIKNYGALRASAGFARFVGMTFLGSVKSLLTFKPGLFWQYWKALVWNLFMLPSSIRQRLRVQRLRLEDDELILRKGVTEEEKVGLGSSGRAS